jgi:hypothetical protein
METIITMIILTGTAVLFLSNVFRQVRDERERAQQRRAGSRRPASGTDQFLEEVNRRRQQASERGKSAPPVRRVTLTPVPAPTIRRETGGRKPVPKADRPRQPPAPARVTSAFPSAQLLEVVPADMPTGSRQVGAETAPAQQVAQQPRPVAMKVTSQPVPALLAQLMPLLRSRQTMRAAFVLHEILGPPLCHHKKVRQR